MLGRKVVRHAAESFHPRLIHIHVDDAPTRPTEQVVVSRGIRVEAQKPLGVEEARHETGVRKACHILVDGRDADTVPACLEERAKLVDGRMIRHFPQGPQDEPARARRAQSSRAQLGADRFGGLGGR